MFSTVSRFSLNHRELINYNPDTFDNYLIHYFSSAIKANLFYVVFRGNIHQ